MQIYKKVSWNDNVVLSIISEKINRITLNMAIRVTRGKSNGRRYYLCDIFNGYHIFSSVEIRDINDKMPKSKRMHFPDLMKCCLFYADKNGEFMK